MTPVACTAIVFDCADTLLHLDPPRETIFAEASADLGLVLDPRAIARAYELADFAVRLKALDRAGVEDRAEARRGMNRMLAVALGVESSWEELHPRLLERFAARRRWVAFDDALPCLRGLAPRFPLHVLANWHGSLAAVLTDAGLGGMFASIRTSEELGAEKPARACFETFSAAAGLDPRTTVYVGNEYLADVVGARAAGLIPVLVDRHGALAAADCLRVTSLGALPDLVR